MIAFSALQFPVQIAAILTERHNSRLAITENPVEGGAVITDHAYTEPKRVSLEMVGENAAITYNALLLFQKSRVPFVLVTGLSVYPNMLIENIDADRDPRTAYVLHAWIDCREVQIVSSGVAPVDVSTIGYVPQGAPGGANSFRQSGLTPELAGDAVTADRASGTVQIGDAAVKTVENTSILRGLFQ